MSITYGDYDNFKELTEGGIVIVDFFTTTCGPCKLYSKVLERIAYDCPFINIVKVNLTDYPKLGLDPAIEAVPTSLFIKEGKIVGIEEGSMSQDEVMGKITECFFEN